MQVYLLKDVPGLGNKGSIKEVSLGYAKNYLLPRQLAKQVTKDLLEAIQQEEKQKKAKEEQLKSQAKALAAQIEKIILDIPLKFQEKGKEAFDSVNKNRIILELSKRGIQLSPHQIILEKPLKLEGLYEVKIILPGQEAILKIRISALESR